MGIQYFLAPTLILLALSACAYGFEGFNIDCGSDVESYTDNNSLPWLRDSNFLKDVAEGQSQVANTSNPSPNDDVMNTLRYFTGGNLGHKYCYKINAPKGRKVLVRASFYYGNYDNKSSPPTFNLEFDGVNWGIIRTSSTTVTDYQVIYVVKADDSTTSVCVSQTEKDQFPFISALQVIHLGPRAYQEVDERYALQVMRRCALAGTAIIRFPDDIYDRVWYPLQGVNEITNISSGALIPIKNTDNDPPQEVLQNAITTPTSIIVLRVGYPFYMVMYFSELIPLDHSTQNRSFRVYQDEEPSSEPIEPPYGGVLEVNVSNLTTSSSTEIVLKPTNGSTLPPLINAFELFYIRELPAVGTSNTMFPNGTNSTVIIPTSSGPESRISDAPVLPNPLGKSTTTEVNIPSSLIIIIWAIVGAFPFSM